MVSDIFSKFVVFKFCLHFMYGGVISYLLLGCRSCLLLPPGVGVVLVFSLVTGHVLSVLSCTCNVALSGGTGVGTAIHCSTATAFVRGWVYWFPFLTVSWGLGSFSIPSGLLVGL
jgi:hypothetical protein